MNKRLVISWSEDMTEATVTWELWSKGQRVGAVVDYPVRVAESDALFALANEGIEAFPTLF